MGPLIQDMCSLSFTYRSMPIEINYPMITGSLSFLYAYSMCPASSVCMCLQCMLMIQQDAGVVEIQACTTPLHCTITTLYYTVLHCTVLVLCCVVEASTAPLHCTVVHCTTLYYTPLYCTGVVEIQTCTTPLHCTTLYYAALYCTGVAEIQACTAPLHCTTLYYTELYYTVLHCTLLYWCCEDTGLGHPTNW